MEKNRVSFNQFFIGFQADDDAGQDDDNIDEVVEPSALLDV